MGKSRGRLSETWPRSEFSSPDSGRWDQQLLSLCRNGGIDPGTSDGAGAAGGLGFSLCVLGGTLQPGAEFILDALQLPRTAGAFDWIITGEGRSDRQTLLGKGPALVSQLARRHGVPVTLLSGAVDHGAALDAAFDGCFSVQSAPVSLEFAMRNAGDLLETAAYQLAKVFATAVSGNAGTSRVGAA